MLKKQFAAITCALTLSFLTGCTGMLMNTSNMVKQPVTPSYNIKPRLYTINSGLISQMRRQGFNQGYIIGAGDVLDVEIWQHPEFNFQAQSQSQMSSQATDVNTNTPSTFTNVTNIPASANTGFLVDSDGSIYMPMVGKVFVAGRTINGARIAINNSLRKYVYHPQTSVRVINFRNKKVYVMGEVMKPGVENITDIALTMSDAINLAGGLDATTSDAHHIYVIRGPYYQPKVYWLNAGSPDAMLLAENFKLQPGDIIFVSSTLVTNWSRMINQILPTVSTVWYTYAVTKN